MSNICPHFKECAGCTEHLSLQPPAIWKEVETFFFPHQLKPALHQGPPVHWRHRAKVAVRGTSLNPLIGLFKRHSHDVCSIPFCLVHHPHLNEAFALIRSWMITHQLLPYDEKTGHGELRYLQGVVQRKTGKVQLAFVLNLQADSPQAHLWEALVNRLGKDHPGLWHSLWLNYNDRKTNRILGPDWSHVWGEKELWEQFGELSVCYGPESFGQANLSLFERMLYRIRELVPPKQNIVEYYAGVGVIGLFIASQSKRVQSNEINPYAEKYFNLARDRLPADVSSRITFFPGSHQQALFLLQEASTVIVDPPRKGLDSVFFKALKEAASVKKLIYISCGWEAFQRDCQTLSQEGWQVQSIDGYSFFPGSDHVELLISFLRI